MRVRVSNKKLMNLFMFLYLFFLSFLNFTPAYLIAASGLVLISVITIFYFHRMKLTSYFLMQFIFIIYNSCYILFGISINNGSTIRMIMTICLNFIINLAIANCMNSIDDIKRVIKWFIPIATFSGIFIILYSKGTGIDGRLGHGILRPFGDESNTYTSMEFASWSLYASVIATYQYINTKVKKWIIPLPFFWLVIVWAGSRKWFVFGLALELAIIYFCSSKNNIRNKIRKIITIFILLSLALLIVFKFQPAYNVIGYRIEGFLNKTESSAVVRNIMRETAIDYILKKPVVGYGLNTFRDISEFNTWSESNILELLYSGGIPLFLIYYGYNIWLILKLYKIRKKDKIYMLFLCFLIMIFISDTVSMSYQGRLESFIMTISSLLVYFEKKNYEVEDENLYCNA